MNKNYCSKHFTFEDFYYCSDTWKTTKVDNTPAQQLTLIAIRDLAINILDPVVEEFGAITLTFGLCMPNLAKQIKKKKKPQIAPNVDQHAGYELNLRGNRVCKRDGFACDFTIEGQNMKTVTKWISENCAFDRIYFYGEQNPIHVSHAPDNKKQIVIMKLYGDRRIPRVVDNEYFI